MIDGGSVSCTMQLTAVDDVQQQWADMAAVGNLVDAVIDLNKRALRVQDVVCSAQLRNALRDADAVARALSSAVVVAQNGTLGHLADVLSAMKLSVQAAGDIATDDAVQVLSDLLAVYTQRALASTTTLNANGGTAAVDAAQALSSLLSTYLVDFESKLVDQLVASAAGSQDFADAAFNFAGHVSSVVDVAAESLSDIASHRDGNSSRLHNLTGDVVDMASSVEEKLSEAADSMQNWMAAAAPLRDFVNKLQAVAAKFPNSANSTHTWVTVVNTVQEYMNNIDTPILNCLKMLKVP